MSMHSSRREVTLETEEVERTQIQVARAYQRVESSDRQRPSRGDLWFYRVEKKGRNGSVGPEESALYQKIRTGYPGRVTMSSEGSCSGVMDFFPEQTQPWTRRKDSELQDELGVRECRVERESRVEKRRKRSGVVSLQAARANRVRFQTKP